MNQPQQKQPTGIVGNTRAAGASATEARAQVKAAWHKGPLFHIGVGISTVLAGIILNQSYDFNLFWSIVVWAGLVKLGKVLSGTEADSWHVWGKISRTAGWAVLLLALANSGFRHFAEGTVIWVEQSLCTFWNTDKCYSSISVEAWKGWTTDTDVVFKFAEEKNPRAGIVTQRKKVGYQSTWMLVSPYAAGYQFCLRPTRPELYNFVLRYEVVKKQNKFYWLKFSEGTRRALSREDGIDKPIIEIGFEMVQQGKPC